MEKNNKNNTPFSLSFGNPVRALFWLAEMQPNRHCVAEPRGNMVRKYTYQELANQVETIARAVSKTRNGETKPIAIIARSSYRMIAAHLGALLGGGKVILIPANTTLEEQEQLIADNGAELLIVDQLEGSRELMDRIAFLPQLRQIWSLHEEPDDSTTQVSTLGWHEVLELADQGKRRITLEDQLEALDDDRKLCRFYTRDEVNEFQHYDYTLGELAEETKDCIEWIKTDYPSFKSVRQLLSIIPFNRVASHVMGIYLPLLTGRMLMAVDRDEAWKAASLPFKADCLISSSGFLSKTAEKLQADVNEHGGLAQFTFSKNIERLKKMTKRRKEGGTGHDGGGMMNFFAGKAVHLVLNKKLREVLNGDIKLCLSIDEGLRYESRLFYQSIALPVLEHDDDELIIEPMKEVAPDMPFTDVRGTQLEKNSDLDQLKIVS